MPALRPEPTIELRRRLLAGAAGLAAVAACPRAAAQSSALPPAAPVQGRPSLRAQREMRLHKVAELGLEIWVENQPPWEAELMQGSPRPMFVAQSPPDYHPPTVMSYWAFRGERVDPSQLERTATVAIRRAAENYRVPPVQRAALKPHSATYGVLSGYEADFDGSANGETVQVRIFVGHTPGRDVIALQAYTLPGKLPNLAEPIRRAWTNLKYLA